MKILYIYGDDYSALHVEQEIGINSAVKMVEENGGELTIQNDLFYAQLAILEFGDVDEKFVDFVQNEVMDYDRSKSENFYVIEEA